jgi:iron complex transport system ATP-binding protein
VTDLEAVPLLDVRSLGIERGARRCLENVSLRLGTGELCMLLGPNGSGKSTLLAAILGTLAPTSGAVFLLGNNLAKLSTHERARKLTLVLQEHPTEFPLTARELVELGRHPHRPSRWLLDDRAPALVARALREVGLTEHAARFVSELSGGERQRAHLGRAFAQEPLLLLLDEPTASLDLAHQLELFEYLQKHVKAGGSVLVAAHDLSLVARYASRVVVLDRGRVVGDGSVAEVLDERLLREVFGVQATLIRDGAGAPCAFAVTGRIAEEQASCR